MLRYILRRLLFMFITLWLVSLVVFSLSRFTGDPREMYLERNTTKEQWAVWGKEWGLDRPLPVQYLVWAGKTIRGDLGKSRYRRVPVTEVIIQKLPATMLLALGAFVLVVACIPLGIISAVRRGSVWDYAGRAFAVSGIALPPFWTGLVLILVFAVWLEWLPAGKRGGFSSYILPSISFGWGAGAGLLRLIRSSMLQVLDEEYIKLARAKGVRQQAIIWRHALKNAAIAPITFSGLLLAGLFTGAVVTEAVFGWPGMGRLAVLTVSQNDFPMIAGLVLFFTLLFVSANLLVDILYGFLDPRIRYT